LRAPGPSPPHTDLSKYKYSAELYPGPDDRRIKLRDRYLADLPPVKLREYATVYKRLLVYPCDVPEGALWRVSGVLFLLCLLIYTLFAPQTTTCQPF
jgi:hypothetical protein